MNLLERVQRLEKMLGITPQELIPNNPHKWSDVYIHGGHYPDGKVCDKCGLYDLSSTPLNCGK